MADMYDLSNEPSIDETVEGDGNSQAPSIPSIPLIPATPIEPEDEYSEGTQFAAIYNRFLEKITDDM